MANVLITNGQAVAVLTEPDAEGDYGWSCICRAVGQGYQPIADAIAEAEVHVDIQCQLILRSSETPCEHCGKPASMRIDPFLSEIYDDDSLHALCDECERDRADEI
jgi:hypothetical protein